MTEALTACRDCKHLMVREGSVRVWYNHLCGASLKPPEFDYLEGAMEAPKHKYCRDVNRDGHCQLFQQRKLAL